MIAVNANPELVGENGSYITVHRAAANDGDFKNRATCGSVCNGLFGLFWAPSVLPLPLRQRQIEPLKHQRRTIHLNISGIVHAETEG